MFFRFFFVFVFLAMGFISPAQNIVLDKQDTMSLLNQQMQKGRSDSIRKAAANGFGILMEQILSDPQSFDLNFDSIKNVSVQTAPDHSFRLYTWQYPSQAGEHYNYFGFLQYQNQKTRKISLFTLVDSSSVLQKSSGKKLKAENWYGCIYYNIIANRKGSKRYYTLLGWKAKNRQYTEKLIDVLSFESGKPVFGLPVFKKNKIYSYRVIFEYASQAVMALRYEADRKLIVFDHLSAGKFTPDGPKGPDGSYDAFKLVKKGHWELQEDVDVDAGFVPKKKPVKIYKDSELQKEKEQLNK